MGLAAVILAPASAREDATNVIDRTFSCEAGYVGGLHQVTIYSAYRTSPGSSKLRASSSVTQNMFESLGSMSSDGFTVHRGHCVPAKKGVRLTTNGLRGGAVPPLGAEVTCETPRRLFLRVRASFAKPVAARTSRQYGFPQLTAMGDLQEAAIALGTRDGETIAYLSVTGTERARLFTLRTCKED
jgi:hypothetical protein